MPEILIIKNLQEPIVEIIENKNESQKKQNKKQQKIQM